MAKAKGQGFKKKKSSVGDILSKMSADLLDEPLEKSNPKIPDIVTFIENEEYLGLGTGLLKHVKLFPLQKIILKVFYRGSRGNENITLTDDEINLLKKEGMWKDHPEAECDRGDVLGKYYSSNEFRELVLVWGRRCVSGDSILVDPHTGKLITIQDLWKSEREISAWTYNTKLRSMQLVDGCYAINQGKRKVYQVTLSSGQTIKATDNHPFLAHKGYKRSSHYENHIRYYHRSKLQEEWVQVKDLKVGDAIAVPKGIPFFGKSEGISEDEASLLGYMTGDGCCSQAAAQFTCASPEILADFTTRANSISDNLEVIHDEWTGADSKEYQYKVRSKRYINETFMPEGSVRLQSRRVVNDLVALLKKHNLMGKTCHKKEVPLSLYECPENVIAAYLRSLFSCDGTLFLKDTKKKKSQVCIEFYTVNPKQAHAVRHLLSRFGICASVKTKRAVTHIKRYNKTYQSVSYRVSFSDAESVRQFLDRIGFVDRTKETIEARSRLDETDYVPNTVRYSKIVSIEEKDEEETFDLCVSDLPELQNYVVNGLISHNSGKDFLVSLIALYEAMRLLETPGGDPYEYYKLSPGADISILTIAASNTQAGIAFKEIREKLRFSKYFHNKVLSGGIQSDCIYLLTPKDIEDNRILEARGQTPKMGSVKIEVGHSNPDTLVGKSCYVLILDEVASYRSGVSGSSSGEKIYALLQPSTSAYVRSSPIFDANGEPVIDPETGEQKEDKIYESKIISISSPRGKEGKLWSLWESHWSDPKVLGCRLPTWVVSSKKHTQESLRREFKAMSETEFACEFGAEFSGSAGENMFPFDLVEKCFKNTLKFREIGMPGYVYFAQLDPASNSHNYALVVCHKEIFLDPKTHKSDFRIIVDMIKVWSPKNKQPIIVEKIDEFVCSLRRRFHLGMVGYDAWQSQASIQKLRKHGIPAKEFKYLRNYKMEIYKELEELLKTDRLKIPYINDDSELLRQEMIHLQRKFDTGSGFKVYHKTDGDACKTDDVVDALAGAIYLALGSGTNRLPKGRTVTINTIPSTNNIVWRSMQGIPYGVGSGQAVSRQLERRSSWPNYKR